MAVSGPVWSAIDRVVVVRSPAALSATDVDALANVISSVAARCGRRVLLVQLAPSLSGPVSVHGAGPDTQTPYARYAAAIRAHVEEVHTVTPGGGAAARILRGLVTAVTKLGRQPTIMHAGVDALVEAMQRRHGIDPSALRTCIAPL